MYSTYEKEIGKNLKAIRCSKNYTQEQVAVKLQVHGCDITRSAVAKMETGTRHIYASELKALKKVFNVTYDDILG
jgi:transcriptional regulator with XRE-family HTH domain